jgi:subtilase family serine protease
LEGRQLLSADALTASPSQFRAQPSSVFLALDPTQPTGLTPDQILNAYEINQITFSGGRIPGNGAGQTIAIVVAYHDPNISADLATFDQEFGLPNPPSFTIENLGATTTDPGWAAETAMDVEWAHAVAPAASIVLVEASTNRAEDLFGAVRYASHLARVSVISMSWGSSEFPDESNLDGLFTTPVGHDPVTYVAASGDSGAWNEPVYPAVSPNVLAVGGTTLTLGLGNTYGVESGWAYSTGGFSRYEPEPSYQTSTGDSVGLAAGVRMTPDVSFNADPNSGIVAYSSVSDQGPSGWFQGWGTSAAAWASLIAIVDQGLATEGKGPLSTSQVLTELYSLPNEDFHDITSGFNGYSATPGYDLVTGLGTPRAKLVVAGLLTADVVSGSTPLSRVGLGGPTIWTSPPTWTSPTTTTTRPTTTSSLKHPHRPNHHASQAQGHHAKIHRTKSHSAQFHHVWPDKKGGQGLQRLGASPRSRLGRLTSPRN